MASSITIFENTSEIPEVKLRKTFTSQKFAETKVVWPYHKFCCWFSKNGPTGHSEKKQKKRT